MRKLSFKMIQRLPDHEKRITLSTCFTLARVLLTPIIVGAMIMHQWGIAVSCFVLASLTDMIDGNLARLRGEKTFLGALLDPIADKILLLSIFFTLAFVRSPLFNVPKWFVWVVLIKEVLQGVGFVVVYMINGHIKIEPRLVGKMTTVAQMLFIMWLFMCYFFNWVPIKTYYTALGILLVLVCASFVQYVYMGIKWVLESHTA